MSSSPEASRRVVVTGVGVVSPVGIGRDEFAQAVLDGTSGIGEIELMDYSGLPGNVGAEVPGFTDATARKVYLNSQRKSVKVMCREIQFGVASAMLALEDSALDTNTIDHSRLGVDFGANQMFSHPLALCRGAALSCEDASKEFRQELWGEKGMAGMEPLWLLKYLPNMPACHIGIAVDARGPNNSLTQLEASANLAVGEAYRIILRGSADMMIAGSTGSRLHPIKCIHAAMWEELAEGDGEPETWCRPFDGQRRGQIIGEGSAAFVLEDEKHARDRGAKILGTVLGAGSSCVAALDGTPNRRQAVVNAIAAALSDAGITAGQVGHVNAHGQGTRKCDVEEALAIRDVFGDATDSLPVTALKSALGNSGAGSGSLELAASLLALQSGVVPRTLNYSQPDPECRLDVVHAELRPVENRTLLKISVNAHGQASALIIAAA